MYVLTLQLQGELNSFGLSGNLEKAFLPENLDLVWDYKTIYLI